MQKLCYSYSYISCSYHMPHQMLQGHKIYASISIVLAYQCVCLTHSVCVHSTIDLYSTDTEGHIVSCDRWHRFNYRNASKISKYFAHVVQMALCVPNIYSAYA